MQTFRNETARAIKSNRVRKGLSIRFLAKKCGISASTVMRIENESVLPDIDTLCKICAAMNLGFTIQFYPLSGELCCEIV